MKTYTICGSMRYAEQMKEIAFYLETLAKICEALDCDIGDVMSFRINK